MRSTVGCGTLFGVVLVGELVVGCVSFCCISFIVADMGSCDSGVFSIIAGDSGVVYDGWSFCCTGFFWLIYFRCTVWFSFTVRCPSYITRTHLPNMWTAFGKCSFMLEHLHTRVPVWYVIPPMHCLG